MELTKNQIVTVKIEDIGNEGEGIGKIDGFPLFIKDAVVGDLAQVRITKAKKNYAYARVEKVLKPSPDRINPPCPYHRQCGGCQIQALSYEKQLEFKERKVRNNLLRIGGFAPEYIDNIMEPVVGMEDPWRYRNKAQYPFGTSKEGEVITGFYAGRTHDIIANTDCLLGVEENQEILEAVLSYMKECSIAAYDETTGKGMLRHVLVRKGFSTEQLMVCLIVNLRKIPRGVGAGETKPVLLPEQEVLLEKLLKIKNVTSVSVNVNIENTNVIMGDLTYTIWGKDTIEDDIHLLKVTHNKTDKNESHAETDDLKSKEYGFTDFLPSDYKVRYQISPRSFYQVNPKQTEKLYSLALDYAELTGTETVWDLYCGIGTISLFLARYAKQVFGVEVIEQAILDARQNAENNGIKNAEFFVGKAEEVLPEQYEKTGTYADVIVVDPPRKGCDAKCLETILKMKPKKVIYVSCDSATLARDLRILCETEYELKKIRAVDQFGHTVHCEVCVLMSRVEK